LRQGDPLSPLLFILAVDTLQAIIHKLQNDLLELPIAKTTLLQFADDTTIVTPAHPTNIKLIMATLDVFAKISGLQVNLSKSGFLPIAIPPDLIPTVTSLINCEPLTLPIQYLGLPLTINTPPKSAYLPLITSVQRRCEGLKGKNLSMAGRAVLTNSVLNVVPLHYMQALLLPKWVTKQFTKITKRFLWRGTKDTYSEGHCLVAWQKITIPKINGGLSIIDIELQNKALLLNWIWLADKNEQCLWTDILNSMDIHLNNSYAGNNNRLS
jgi:Reverse transcriptase (RNA-dependent DNA polymerase)